jgi:hypothetical protein
MPEPKYYASTHSTGMCMCRICLQADQIPPNLAAKIEAIWLQTERRRRQLEAIAKPMDLAEEMYNRFLVRYASFLYFAMWAITTYFIYNRYARALTPFELISLVCVNYVLIGGIYYGVTHHAWWVVIPATLFYIGLYV